MKHMVITLVLLMAAWSLSAQWHIDEGFEGISTLPAGWSFIDDGDGMTWRNLSHTNAHSGQRAAFVDNYLPNQNADWLITPQLLISEGDSLSFYTRAWVGTEDLKVYISTTGSAANNFNTQLIHLQGLGTTYQYASVSLNQYAGMHVYLGFFWQCDTYGILVDDVKIGQPLNITPELNLPDEISFFASEGYSMDFTPYAVATDINNVNITVEPNQLVDIQIGGLQVSFTATDYIGSTPAIFTLHDQLSGLNATDTLLVNVMQDPSVDLLIQSVLSPRDREYLLLPFTPAIEVLNAGTAIFDNQIEVQLSITGPDGESVHSDTAFMDMNLAPDELAEVIFPSSFTPAQEGTYTYLFEIITEDGYPDNNNLSYESTVVYRVSAGGPDDFGYRFLDSNDPLGPDYDWIEISQSGTSSITYQVPTFGGDDNFSEPIPLGFNFPFYGSVYSTAYVDINGELLLAGNNWYNEYPDNNWDYDGNMFNYMYPIPGYNQMPGLIAVYWDDLHADQGTGDVYFQSFGEAPARYTVIQWDNVRFHAGSGGDSLLKFQVILHESGDIKMQYHSVATGQTGASIPHDYGLSATVAIQNEAANAGLSYLREIVQNNSYVGIEPAGNMLHNDLAILFYAGTDTQPPIITHTEVGNSFVSDMELVATIADMSSLDTISLHYDLGSGWQEQDHTTSQGMDYFFNLNDIAPGSRVKYYFSAMDEHGNTATLPVSAPDEFYDFEILPGTGSQVLIMYSGRQDYQRVELPIYEDILTDLNISYDVYNWEEYPDFSIPEQYEGLLVYSSTGTVSDQAYTLATAITNYLDLGTPQAPKNVWFASDGLASSQHAHPNSSAIRRMMSGYFRTYYVATGLGGGTNGLGGPESFEYANGTIKALPGTQVGEAGEEYPVYANSPDCIFPSDAAGDPYYDEVPYPEIGANYVYAFEDGPIGGQAYLYHGVAGTTVDTPSFRTMYFSFDFSQLSDPAHRIQWMQDLMNWWQISPTSNAGAETPQIVSEIKHVYPNPFNPQTNIRYNTAKAGLVNISVYNIRGQKVRELVNENKASGNHSISWDGNDAKGKAVASGVYYLRMVAGDKRDSKKITLIK